MSNPKSIALRAFATEPYNSLDDLLASKAVNDTLIGQRLYTKNGHCVDVVSPSANDYDYVAASGTRLKKVESYADEGALLEKQFVVTISDGQTVYASDDKGEAMDLTKGSVIVFAAPWGAQILGEDVEITREGELRILQAYEPGSKIVIQQRSVKPSSYADAVLADFEERVGAEADRAEAAGVIAVANSGSIFNEFGGLSDDDNERIGYSGSGADLTVEPYDIINTKTGAAFAVLPKSSTDGFDATVGGVNLMMYKQPTLLDFIPQNHRAKCLNGTSGEDVTQAFKDYWAWVLSHSTGASAIPGYSYRAILAHFEIPQGRYNVDLTGDLLQVSGTTRRDGLTIRGVAGMGSTYINTIGDGAFLRTTGNFSRSLFQGLAFGVESGDQVIFGSNADGGTYRTTFRDIRTKGAKHVYSLEGTASESEITTDACVFSDVPVGGATYFCENSQSKNHVMINTTLSSVGGTILKFGGGGAFTMLGGDIILDGGENGSLFLHMYNGGGVGLRNNKFKFIGLKPEFRSTKDKLALIEVGAFAEFDSCILTSVEGDLSEPRITINNRGVVRLMNSSVDIVTQVNGGAGTSSDGIGSPRVEMVNCNLVRHVDDLVKLNPAASGTSQFNQPTATVDGCDMYANRFSRLPVDVCLGQGVMSTGRSKAVKTYRWRYSDSSAGQGGLPDQDQTLTARLPLGATIRTIRVVNDGTGSAALSKVWTVSLDATSVLVTTAKSSGDHYRVQEVHPHKVTTTGLVTVVQSSGNSGTVSASYLEIEWV
jgi:hypothetical protein